MSKVLKSNDDIIEEAFSTGKLADVFDEWDTDDLIKLRLEITRSETLNGILETGSENIIAALKRIGWTDHVAEEIAVSN